MTAKELYEKYAGYEVQLKRYTSERHKRKGIVCGYTQFDNKSYIIWALDPLEDRGWTTSDYNFITHKKHPNGYHGMHEEGLIDFILIPPKIINPLDSSIAEGYINEHFKTLDDDTRDIYINIFLAGYEFKQLEKRERIYWIIMDMSVHLSYTVNHVKVKSP